MSKVVRLANVFGAPGAPSALTRWFDARLNDAADGFAAATEIKRRRRVLVFDEQPDWTFAGAAGTVRIEGGVLSFASSETQRALAGADVEFRLAPQRCVFRELELPARAADFLEGVVRAQIDRLTPWRADEAIFGCSKPAAVSPDRIRVTIAARKRAPLDALFDVGADAVRLAVGRESDPAPISLASRRSAASFRRARWRLWLAGALVASLLAGVAAMAADWTLGDQWRDEATQLAASLGARRAAILGRERAVDDPAAQALLARKRATPAAVVVLEALSRAIPDDAYLTELQIAGDKVEIAGLAVDAAALVKHIEQSPRFARALFTAPTTRGADDRESFRIEIQVARLSVASP